MADGFTATLDTAGFTAAVVRFGDTAERYTKAASKISVDNVQAEMRRRVARATGQTAADILVSDMPNGGYAVHTEDVNPFTGLYYRGKHVGLWLEKGTRLGKRGSHASAARPWFFSSAQLEMGAHERRIHEALQRAGSDVGLGD